MKTRIVVILSILSFASIANARPRCTNYSLWCCKHIDTCACEPIGCAELENNAHSSAVSSSQDSQNGPAQFDHSKPKSVGKPAY